MAGVRLATIAIVATATIAPLAGVADPRRLHHQRKRLRRERRRRGGDRRRPDGAGARAAARPAAAPADFEGAEAEPRLTMSNQQERNHSMRTKTTRLSAAGSDGAGARPEPRRRRLRQQRRHHRGIDVGRKRRRRRRDRLQPRQREGEPDDRLEELPRIRKSPARSTPRPWQPPATRSRPTSASARKRSR